MWPTLFEVPVSHGDYTANTYGLLVLLAVAVT